MLRTTLTPGVEVAVTERDGGVSAPPYGGRNLGAGVGDDPAAVATNRERLAGELGLPAGHVAWLRQVHGREVAVLTEPPAEPPAELLTEPPEADGAVTAVPGLALAVLVADCLPVVLADGAAGVVGVAHAGRRGVQVGVVPAVLDAMTGLGADPGRVAALLGPCVCPAHYELPAAMRDEVAAAAPGAAAATPDGTPAVDLRAGVLGQLRRAGVRRWTVLGDCTVTDPRRYSYRRDGVTGRFATLAWLAAR